MKEAAFSLAEAKFARGEFNQVSHSNINFSDNSYYNIWIGNNNINIDMISLVSHDIKSLLCYSLYAIK